MNRDAQSVDLPTENSGLSSITTSNLLNKNSYQEGYLFHRKIDFNDNSPFI
jgi:hypothetical protein